MRQEITSGNFSDSVAIVPKIVGAFAGGAADQSFTVPGNELWKLNFARCFYTTSAVLGNRLLQMEFSDPDGRKKMTSPSPLVQIAISSIIYNFLPGFGREEIEQNGDRQVSIPINSYLLPGWSVRVLDINTIDPAAETLVVDIQYEKIII